MELKDRVEMFIEILERKATVDLQKLEDFQSKFMVDPLWSLNWSRETFEAAARLSVFSRAAAALKDELVTILQLKENATREIMRKSRNASCSTSPTANFAEACSASAYVELYELLEEG